jgi:predicted phosphodiesterase
MGDIHVYRLWTWPWHLLSKRVLGQANLWLNRRGKFDLDMLPRVVQRIQQIKPSVFIQAGDLTTTALRSEFQYAADKLDPLFAADDIAAYLVPGNHDRYTFTSHREKHFEHYFGRHAPTDYPWRKQLAEGLHIIGLDATRANIFDASGDLGEAQRRRLAELLDELPRPVRQVFVVCHYPIGNPPGFARQGPGHRMADMEQATRLLADSGLPIVYIHGHVHQPWCWRHRDAANVLTINCGAPVMRDPIHPAGQGFWQIDVQADGQLALRRHVCDRDGNWAERSIVAPTDPDGIAEVW